MKFSLHYFRNLFQFNFPLPLPQSQRSSVSVPLGFQSPQTPLWINPLFPYYHLLPSQLISCPISSLFHFIKFDLSKCSRAPLLSLAVCLYCFTGNTSLAIQRLVRKNGSRQLVLSEAPGVR